MFGAAAMSLSSFCVVTNALRLNLFDIRDTRHDRKRHKKTAITASHAGDAENLNKRCRCGRQKGRNYYDKDNENRRNDVWTL